MSQRVRSMDSLMLLVGALCAGFAMPTDALVAQVVQPAVPAAAADGWQTVDASTKGFSFAMPGKPTVNQNGDYVFGADNGNTAFIVSIRETNESLEATADDRLRATMDVAEKAAKGKLASDRPLKLDGHPGVAFSIVCPDDTEYRYRVFLVDKRSCQMLVVRSGQSQTAPAAVNRFFDSLKITGPAVVAAPASPAGASSAPAGWVTTAVEPFDLSFAMPGKPQGDGKGNFTFATDNSNTVFKVALALSDQSLEANAAAKLDALRDIEVKNLNGKLQSDRSFDFQGHKGREFVISVPGQVEIDARFWAIVADRRLIELIVVRTADSQTPPANIKQFFSSFKLGLGAGTTVLATPPANNPAPEKKSLPEKTSSSSLSLIGMTLDDAKKADLFTFFHFEQTASNAGPNPGTTVLTFKPQGPAFRDFVTLRVGLDGQQRIAAIGLFMLRSFVDDATNGAFARDLAKSMLRSALPADDVKTISESLNEIEFGGLASSGVIVGNAPIPKLPDQPSVLYVAYLGKVPESTKRLSQTQLKFTNRDIDGKSMLMITLEPAGQP